MNFAALHLSLWCVFVFVCVYSKIEGCVRWCVPVLRSNGLLLHMAPHGSGSYNTYASYFV